MTGPAPEEDGADAANRGRRAAIGADGSVRGSGAGAGGGGAPEDFDDDPASGGGPDIAPRASPPPGRAEDASKHGGR